MTTNKISKTRLLILFAVHDGFHAGRQPSLRDLARMTGTRINNVWNHLEALEKAGLISRERCEAGSVSHKTTRPEFRFITPEQLEEEHAVRDDRGR